MFYLQVFVHPSGYYNSFNEKSSRQENSFLLFNLVFKNAVRDSGLNMRGNVVQKTLLLLEFVNNIDINE
jgi:hypothetical protein